MKVRLEKRIVTNHLFESIFFSGYLLFSVWLMFSTFSYDHGSMAIATKAWSDFASHIPLIRSFSLGFNFPVEYPLFPGEPIKYHFLFYFFAGMLERFGIRVDLALNLLSALSFFALLVTVYLLSFFLVRKRSVSILVIIFFLFNGSFSFFEFFKIHPLSPNIISDIIHNSVFPSFGPYDGKIVSAFWNLNIFTNQRHLAASYFFSLLLVFWFLKEDQKKEKQTFSFFIIGLCIGLLFFFNQAVFVMNLLLFGSFFILYPSSRIYLLLTGLIAVLVAIPQYLLIQPAHTTFKPTLIFGYLIHDNLTIASFLHYWFFNLGLHSLFIPMAVFLVPSSLRKLLLSYFLLFVIGNSIQFSPEIAANHKFFNYFLLIGAIGSAYIVVLLWNQRIVGKIMASTAFLLLILSGVIDFFPIANDGKIMIADYPIDQDIRWVMYHTPKTAVFLNTQYLYNKASLAGRKIFLGWPYFAWSAGYDTNARDAERKRLYMMSSVLQFCPEANTNHIRFVLFEDANAPLDFPVNRSFFSSNFKLAYSNDKTGFTLYDISPTCAKFHE